MMRNLMLSILVFAVAAALAHGAWAQQDAPDAIESGRRSLTHRDSYPWYDAEQDAVRRIELKPDAEDDAASHRDSSWEAQPAPQRLRPSAGIGGGALGVLLQGGLWTLLALALAVVVWLIVRWFFRSEARQQEAAHSSQTSREVDRLEELPFAVKRPQSDLLGEARRHYQAGNFAEAIVYLFSYQLVELDKHQVIRLSKGKTNRQYLGESRKRPTIVPLLEETMVAFEDVFFGHHSLDRQRFESCWSRLDQFQRDLQGGLT